MEGRDSRGHFIKGDVPWNKRLDSPRVITFNCNFYGKTKPVDENGETAMASITIPCLCLSLAVAEVIIGQR